MIQLAGFLIKRGLLMLLLCGMSAMALQAKSDEPVELTTTFLVIMPKQKAATVTKTLKKEAGVKKVETNLKEQTVVVTFSAEENTVSNLLKQFKLMGVTAAAMETGCFGSKEGCINAIKPENTMR